jgi:hypothetical protein
MHRYVCGLLVPDPSTMDGDPYDRLRSVLLEALPKVSRMSKRLATVPLRNGRGDDLKSSVGTGVTCGIARRPAPTSFRGPAHRHRAGSCRYGANSSVDAPWWAADNNHPPRGDGQGRGSTSHAIGLDFAHC